MVTLTLEPGKAYRYLGPNANKIYLTEAKTVMLSTVETAYTLARKPKAKGRTHAG